MVKKSKSKHLTRLEILPTKDPNRININGMEIELNSAGIACLVEGYLSIYGAGIANDARILAGEDKTNLLKLLKFVSNLGDKNLETSIFSTLARDLYFKLK